ncbi:hypothetical protein D3C71_1353320 [compost metagenome]
MRLLLGQAHVGARACHGFQEVENVGGAGARQGGDGVKLLFRLHPKELAGGRHDGFDLCAFGRVHGRAGVQRAHALAHQRWRVGHGAHDALGGEPLGNAVGADAGGHAQVQGLLRVSFCLRGGIFEGLGLDGPHHDAGALQGRARFRLGFDPVVLLQRSARIGPGFDHLDLAGRVALADQPADDGAGHVAAADEGDGGKG